MLRKLQVTVMKI